MEDERTRKTLKNAVRELSDWNCINHSERDHLIKSVDDICNQS